MNEWLTFFRAHFPTESDADAFVVQCESIGFDYRPGERPRDYAPKIMMHQTVRLMTLADRAPSLAHSHPLALFFMVVCTECVAKIFEQYDGDGRSKAFVRKFFHEHVSKEDAQKLMSLFSWQPYAPMSLTDVADLLYSIRCDVAHEGRYWGFSFPDGSHGRTRLNLHPKYRKGEKAVAVAGSLNQIKDILVRGCIAAVRKALEKRQQASAT